MIRFIASLFCFAVVLPACTGAEERVVINELLAHSHGKASDWIELYNTTDKAIDIGGWYLSDSGKGGLIEKKYRIASDTVIEACGYLVFYQYDSFGKLTDSGCIEPFGLSEAGETVYLVNKDGASNQVAFDASPNGRSFGRFEKTAAPGSCYFTPMDKATPGAQNSLPYISPVVITEIYYNPPEGKEYEFIELKNRSERPVVLVEREVTTAISPEKKIKEDLSWCIKGIGFEFPVNTILAAGEVVVVAKNPALACYAGLGKVFGPYSGALNNGGEQIELQIPGDLEYGSERYMIPIEKVDYSESAPWPVSADGASLNRANLSAYANDYSNWRALAASPGH